ncbi:hypothetical protein CWI39_2298p0020, partial [Hamiltosporidium magnivora]
MPTYQSHTVKKIIYTFTSTLQYLKQEILHLSDPRKEQRIGDIVVILNKRNIKVGYHTVWKALNYEKYCNDKDMLEGMEGDILEGMESVNNKGNDYKGVSNSSNDYRGVSNKDSKSEGVSNKDSKSEGVNKLSSEQQGVNKLSNKQHPVNNTT